MEDLSQLENKAGDPDGLEHKAAVDHEARKRAQYDSTDKHSTRGGDVAPSQAKAVASGATRVVGNLHDNSN